jgi:hypothetical protein
LLDLLSVIIPLGVLLTFNLIVFFIIIVGVYKKDKSTRRPEKEFEMCKFIIGTIFICGRVRNKNNLQVY